MPSPSSSIMKIRSSASTRSRRSITGPSVTPTSGTTRSSRTAGNGYMREAMTLVFRYAFSELRLHRLQANVQPGNERSLALLRSTGWREEGYARRYLKVGGRWRDHVLFAILAEDVRSPVPGRRGVYDRRHRGTRPSDATEPPGG